MYFSPDGRRFSNKRAAEEERSSEAAAGADSSAPAQESFQLLVEWVDMSQLVRPPPASALQPREARALPLGTPLDMMHEGGWWPVVTLERRQANAKMGEPMSFRVQAIGYQVERWGEIDVFRLPASES